MPGRSFFRQWLCGGAAERFADLLAHLSPPAPDAVAAVPRQIAGLRHALAERLAAFHALFHRAVQRADRVAAQPVAATDRCADASERAAGGAQCRALPG